MGLFRKKKTPKEIAVEVEQRKPQEVQEKLKVEKKKMEMREAQKRVEKEQLAEEMLLMQEGIDAYEFEDYKYAFSCFKEAAEMGGTAQMLFYTDPVYSNGEGTAKDEERDLMWYKKAASQGVDKARKWFDSILQYHFKNKQKSC